ncbi:prolyl-tRNA synthetase [Candidatus Saccharibacteria bacterium]|nr:prolyl-tRNA synthetase [Candidatus Saccharibacteria bacterium]HOR23452.1 His/Gly/Thr/Pro-type tRNA ligase C-terminal domain-containing protein [Candidatus Saccharibacteria bacterium]
MRYSQIFTKTGRAYPADEQAKNAQLLIKAGFIHKEMSGVYAFLPLGLRVLENVKNIIREEMNAIGGQEVQMTILQPRDIWEKTDRWDDTKVDNWFKTKLFNGTELGVGLTHEEPVVDMLGEYIHSYKDLPLFVYQIQTKFRNELRAKGGLLRGREFVMKDMYSFARTQQEHEQLYEQAIEAYKRVFDRLQIGNQTYRTFADGGIFTERFSDEWTTVCEAGENTVYIDEARKLAINAEIYNTENLDKLGFRKENLVQKKGVEAGNTFHIESKYTDALGVHYADERGQKQSIIMGCYGIGVSRIVGLLAEYFADDKGLVWPEGVAPFDVCLVQIGTEAEVKKECQSLYTTLTSKGIEVLWDDRNERPGVKFADADLLGIPNRLVVSKNTVTNDNCEIKKRTLPEVKLVSRNNAIKSLAL